MQRPLTFAVGKSVYLFVAVAVDVFFKIIFHVFVSVFLFSFLFLLHSLFQI